MKYFATLILIFISWSVYAITPRSIDADTIKSSDHGTTWTLPTCCGTELVGISGTQSLSNKTINFSQNTFGGFTAGSLLFHNGTTAAQNNNYLFWDDTNYRLGVGTNSLTTTINGSSYGDVLASQFSGSTVVSNITAKYFSSTGADYGPQLRMFRARNTSASPAIVQSGDTLGKIQAYGYDGVDYELSAEIVFTSGATPGSNDMPGSILFKVTPDANVATATALTIANDGKATFAQQVTGSNGFVGSLTGNVTGNATTADALSSNPSDCSADTYAIEINAAGNLACSTVTNSGLAGNIALSKLASQSNNTIVSNISGGAASPSANSVTSVLDTIGSTQGMILYRGASAWSALATGTSGQFLKTQGAGANPVWAAASGGGGGGSLKWLEEDNSPLFTVANHMEIYQYQAALGQYLYAMIRVPWSYQAGTQIFLYAQFYSASTSGTALLQSVSTLIRAGTDAITSTTNQRTSTNSAVTLSGGTANIPQTVTMDLSDSSGQINSVAVSPGDLILIKLIRNASDTSTGDFYVPVYSAEVRASQ